MLQQQQESKNVKQAGEIGRSWRTDFPISPVRSLNLLLRAMGACERIVLVFQDESSSPSKGRGGGGTKSPQEPATVDSTLWSPEQWPPGVGSARTLISVTLVSRC